MGFLSRFEGKMEDTVEGAAGKLSRSPISPVQIAKKCERQMMRSKMVGAGKQYAPTLYTVLVNPDDDERLFSFYPTLAGETETYLRAKAGEQGLYMDGEPLVRFIVDDGLRHGKFDVIAEVVASAIIGQLRQEEMERYGIISAPAPQNQYGGYPAQPQQHRQPAQQQPAPYYDEPDPYDSQYPADPYDPANYDEYEEQADPYAPPSVEAYADPLGDPLDVMAGAGAGAAAGAGAGAAASVAAEATQFIGSRASQAPTASLLDVTNNRTLPLRQPCVTAGRANDCDITISDINASRHHAEFIRQNSGMWIVRDLGSKNGTLVNGRTIQQPTALQDGDQLTIGLTELVFTLTGSTTR